MLRRLLIATGVSWLALSVPAQSYRLQGRKEALYAGSACIMGSVAWVLYSAMKPLSEQEILMLRVSDLNPLDRMAADLFSSAADRRSDLGQDLPLVLAASASWIFPALDMNRGNYRNEALTLFVLWGEVNLISSTVTHLTKNWIRRPRPYLYNPEVSLDLRQTRSGRQSFLSGHAVTSAANAFFLATLFSDYFPESHLAPFVWGLAATVPAWTCLERVRSGRHFPTDVIAGYGFGALCGILVPRLHRVNGNDGRPSIEVKPVHVPSGAGLTLSLRF